MVVSPCDAERLSVALDSNNVGVTGVGTYVRSLIAGLAARPDICLRPYGGRHARPLVRNLGARLRLRTGRMPLPPPRAQLLHHPDHAFPSGVRHSRKIVTVHDISFHLFPGDYSTEHSRFYTEAIKRQVGEGMLLLCDSESTRRGLIEHFDAAGERCHTVHLGLEDIWFDELSKAPHGDRPLRPHLLHVGAWVPRKRMATVLDAYDIYCRESPDPLDLILAGPLARDWSTEAARVLPRLEQRRSRGRVRILDQVDDRTVRSLYQRAAAYVTATRWEGFGLTVLQAMAAGVPVVAPRHSSLPEIAGEAAYWAPASCQPDELAEALIACLADGGELTASARARARQFTVGKMVQETVDAYRREARP